MADHIGVTFSLEIEAQNAAFQDNPAGEVSRILMKIQQKIENGWAGDEVVMDLNGNRVGRVYFAYGPDDDVIDVDADDEDE